MALVEDIGEAITGDIIWEKGQKITKDKNQKHAEEKQAVIKLFQNIPNAKEYIDLWKEYDLCQTPEAKFVRQIDKLEMALALQAAEYAEQTNLPKDKFQEFFDNASKYTTDPQLKHLLNKIKKS